MPAPRIGRFSLHNSAASAGAELPVLRNFFMPSLAASTTATIRVYPRQAGTIRGLSAFATATTGTVSVDVRKNGTTVLSSVPNLTGGTPVRLDGLGPGGVGSGFFNTNTETNQKALRYERGDYIDIVVTVAASSSATNLAIELTCDEQQPPTGTTFA
jgi:hypothetical protein